MAGRKHILVVLGTRPEAIKLAPVVFALRERPDDACVTLCSTGQHRSMLDETLAAFELRPDHELGVMRPGQHPTDLLSRLLAALRPLLAELRPDTVVVQGDTTTVMAAALAGYLDHVRVAHVEAGLRTGDKRAPFPEEVNRRVTGVLADDHFVPTPGARENLLAEGVPRQRIFLTGNTIVDALRWMRRRVADVPPPARLVPPGRRLVLVTAHRRESFGGPLRDLCLALRDLAGRFDDVQLVYPVHLNPRVRGPVHEILGDVPRVSLTEPLPYGDFVGLLVRASLVLTDSGGIQEEAPSLGTPTLVLREKTERPEALRTGVVRLVGTSRARIVAEAARILADGAARPTTPRPLAVYGDGRAARRIAEVLIDGRMTTPPFEPEA